MNEGISARSTSASVEISVSDPAELRSLRQHLERIPAVEIRQVPGELRPGELGVWDVVQALATSGGALAVAVRTIPAFVRSRRVDLSITVKAKDKIVTITAKNAEEALTIIERVLDA